MSGFTGAVQIAKRLFYSPNHLGILFKEKTGLGFNDYVTKFRMEKAADYLVNSTYRISEITEMVGYRSTNAFTIKFKEYYKVSPTQYRLGERKKE